MFSIRIRIDLLLNTPLDPDSVPIRIGKKFGSGIREKRPGSATLGTSSNKIAKFEFLFLLSAEWNHLLGTGFRTCDLLPVNFTSLFFCTERNITNFQILFLLWRQSFDPDLYLNTGYHLSDSTGMSVIRIQQCIPRSLSGRERFSLKNQKILTYGLQLRTC
jgi:hypothetical protein